VQANESGPEACQMEEQPNQRELAPLSEMGKEGDRCQKDEE
jgi:hypothetical protein